MCFRDFVIQNFPFLEDDFDALTDYELFCKMVEYMRNALEDVDSYQTQLTEFKARLDYYENYFNNLDVQEEINNKLDEMTEDGTLEHIIASYLQTQKIYNTFDEMAEDVSNLVDGLNVQTLGYHSYNDDGGAFYKITDTISLTDYQVQIGTLYATLIINNEMNVKQFGAYGDDTHDDTNALQNALNTCKRLIINNGTYLTNVISLNNNQQIIGDNATLHMKDNIDNNSIFSISNKSNILIENLNFKGLISSGDYTTQSTNFGIKITGSNIKIINCNFNNFGRDGIYSSNTSNLIIDKCYFQNCNTNGVAFVQELSHIKILNNVFINNPYQNINFEHNNPSIKVNDVIIKNNTISWNDTTAKDKANWGVSVACLDTVESNTTKYSNIIIEDNYIKNVFQTFQCRLITNLLINNNNCEGCNRGVWIDSANNDNLYQSNITISNNTFSLSGNSTFGMTYINTDNLKIINNTILNSISNNCIQLSRCLNNLIDGNKIENSEKRAISLTGYTQNTNIINNYIKDTTNCIYITSNQEDPLYLTIDNNTFIDTNINDTYILRASTSDRKNVTLTNFTKIVGDGVNLGLQIRTNEFDGTTCNIELTDKYTS